MPNTLLIHPYPWPLTSNHRQRRIVSLGIPVLSQLQRGAPFRERGSRADPQTPPPSPHSPATYPQSPVPPQPSHTADSSHKTRTPPHPRRRPPPPARPPNS